MTIGGAYRPCDAAVAYDNGRQLSQSHFGKAQTGRNDLAKGFARRRTRRSCRTARLVDQGFQNPWDGIRNARLKREDAFSHAMIIVSSAMVSSS